MPVHPQRRAIADSPAVITIRVVDDLPLGQTPGLLENVPLSVRVGDAIAAHDQDLAEQLIKQRVRRITEAIRKTFWTPKEVSQQG